MINLSDWSSISQLIYHTVTRKDRTMLTTTRHTKFAELV